MRLYWHYVCVYTAGLLQYRASLILRILSTLLTAVLEASGIALLFSRFRLLGNWTMAECLLLYAVASMAFGFAEWLGRGFDKFPPYVASGDFDRMLLRPRSTALQVLGTRCELSKLGRVIQGALLMTYCLPLLQQSLTPATALLLAAAVAGGVFIYTGVFIIFAALSFWTIQSVELAYMLTNLTLDLFQYPMEVYAGWLRSFFTFIVPLAAITYYPLLAVLDKPDPTGMPVWFHWTAPVMGPLFLAAALLFWQAGVRHYHSTGS